MGYTRLWQACNLTSFKKAQKYTKKTLRYFFFIKMNINLYSLGCLQGCQGTMSKGANSGAGQQQRCPAFSGSVVASGSFEQQRQTSSP